MFHWIPFLLLLARPPHDRVMHLLATRPGHAANRNPVQPLHDTVVQVTFTFSGLPTPSSGDTVYYNAVRPLQLSDFAAQPRYHGRSGAISFTSFAYGGSSRLLHDTLQVHLFLQVFFIKSASWVLPEMANAGTLAHEQLHFDLTYLVAMRFRQKILALPLPPDDFDSMIQYEYLESFREMNQVQDRYDADTRSGTGSSAQQAWAGQVKKWLALAAQGMPIPPLQSPY